MIDVMRTWGNELKEKINMLIENTALLNNKISGTQRYI